MIAEDYSSGTKLTASSTLYFVSISSVQCTIVHDTVSDVVESEVHQCQQNSDA